MFPCLVPADSNKTIKCEVTQSPASWLKSDGIKLLQKLLDNWRSSSDEHKDTKLERTLKLKMYQIEEKLRELLGSLT